MKKLIGLAAIPAIALAASAFAFAPAASAATAGTPTVVATGTIHLNTRNLYLDDRANNTVEGAAVVVWQGNGGAAQVWQLMSDGTIRHNGLCLDVAGASKAAGAKIDLWRCNGGANQWWAFGFTPHSDEPTIYDSAILNPVSRKVLNDPRYGGNGTQQILWADSSYGPGGRLGGSDNEVWSLTTLPPPWGVSFQGVSCDQETGTLFGTVGSVNVTGGPVNGTYTDIDVYVNGVRVGDVAGPTQWPPGDTWPGFGKAGGDGFFMSGNFQPNTTYTLTARIRSGATVLATSAPYTLVMPGSDDTSWSGCFEE